MLKPITNWIVCAAVLLAASAGAAAPPRPQPASHPATRQAPALENLSVTQHQVKLADGSVLKYSATAANMPMRDEAGKLKANVFFVAYEAERAAGRDAAQRPITFVFNGGPGAASVWLHLGTAGPWIVQLTAEGDAPAPPYRLTDNPYTWLAGTDLVFIDPIGTGFSRPAPGEAREQFFGVQEDIRWVGEFIRLYLTRSERWASPKFLAGESYGTTRAAGLSEYLLDRLGIALNGIVFISSALDFQTIRAGKSNDLGFVMYLPAYAAVAWYHKKLGADLQADLGKTLAEVERYAIDQYMAALAKGDSLPAERRGEVAKKLARYTGLSEEYVLKASLRIEPSAFQNRLLGDARTLIGRFDGRITGVDPDPTSSGAHYDPSLSRILPVYAATFNQYVRQTLKYESDLPYEVLTDRVQPWNYGQAGWGYLTTADDLRAAMIKNPHMRVFFASGWFDLATPYYATDYTINHLNLPPELRENITRRIYRGGHMLYHVASEQPKLTTDILAFLRNAAPATRPAE